jgi:hypothetical protein
MWHSLQYEVLAASDAACCPTAAYALCVLQALAAHALGGRLQAGPEVFNRHAAEA